MRRKGSCDKPPGAIEELVYNPAQPLSAADFEREFTSSAPGRPVILRGCLACRRDQAGEMRSDGKEHADAFLRSLGDCAGSEKVSVFEATLETAAMAPPSSSSSSSSSPSYAISTVAMPFSRLIEQLIVGRGRTAQAVDAAREEAQEGKEGAVRKPKRFKTVGGASSSSGSRDNSGSGGRARCCGHAPVDCASGLESKHRGQATSGRRHLYLQWRSLPLPPIGNNKLPRVGASSAASDDGGQASQDNAAALAALFPTPGFVRPELVRERNLWLGSFHSSGLHFDGMDNLLMLLQGCKLVHLYPPSELPALYPFPHAAGEVAGEDDRGCGGSQAGDCDHAERTRESVFKSRVGSRLAWDSSAQVGAAGEDKDGSSHAMQARFPWFGQAEWYAGWVCAGDAVFIPNGWWHEVFTPNVATAVNLWFQPSQKSQLRPTILYLYGQRILTFLEEKRRKREAKAAATRIL